ncbi:hypothetical protein ACFCXC_03575 [Streptomyces microflavus]|uniref:TROVE domain-containing protein n=1 Tax=Streptomyces microflavus TaxID=1919 RepID=A0A7H8MJY1_STRMI|nr:MULTISPECIES: hypothetical protein [Streptomyces]QKW42616.1 hypothetical protein HUT09_08540 [Streptomyces microflavus]QTA31565.1 hypothetical protein JHY03_17000 [Streptomyces sp. CA-256286]WSR90913.1 hypothetical protein OG728_11055 [Streptomyces microflavus]
MNTSETLADLVAAEDVLLFVNAAITATGQREFRSDAVGQQLSLDFLHAYVRVNYRRVYASSLALDINDHNAARIVLGLLETAGEASAEERRTEGRLIAARLALLPPQRVYRLFGEVRRAGINNRRTRAIMRDWLAARPDLGHDAVKYRGGVKTAARHIHLRCPEGAGPLAEVGAFLFRPGRLPRYEHRLLDAWRRAHYEQGAVAELPFTVAEGFAARHGMKREVFLKRAAPRMTRLERLRTHSVTQRPEIDLTAMPLTRLALYVLSLPFEQRAARRTELTGALRTAARRAAGGHAGSWGRVHAVLDDSFSSSGSGQKRRRPLAVALAGHHLLEALAAPGAYRGLWTSGRGDALLVRPWGPTPLGMRVLDALEPGPGGAAPDRLVIVSDGWDNAPAGLAGEVLRVWRKRLDPGRRTAVVHVNPVYDADGFDVRRLAAGVPTAGIRDAEDLPALVEIARFAEGRTGAAELHAYLDRRVALFLGEKETVS